MAASSQYLAEAFLAYMLQNPTTPIAKPATVYVALCTTIPTSTTPGTEVTGGSYARVAVTTSSTNFTENSTVSPGIIKSISSCNNIDPVILIVQK